MGEVLSIKGVAPSVAFRLQENNGALLTDFVSQSSGSPNVPLFAFKVVYLICWFLSHKVLEENGEQVPCYSVMVSLQEVGGAETKNWTVPRKLSEFQNLHRKLSEV